MVIFFFFFFCRELERVSAQSPPIRDHMPIQGGISRTRPRSSSLGLPTKDKPVLTSSESDESSQSQLWTVQPQQLMLPARDSGASDSDTAYSGPCILRPPILPGK